MNWLSLSLPPSFPSERQLRLMEIVGRAPFSRNQLKLNKSGGRTGRRRKVANSPLSRVENFDRRNVAYTHTHALMHAHLDASSRKISFYGEQRPTRGLLPPLYRCPPCASIVKYRGPLVGSRKYEQKVELSDYRVSYDIYIIYYI